VSNNPALVVADTFMLACHTPCREADPCRSYVFYLETRVDQLEALLRANSIQFPPADNLEHCSRPSGDGTVGRLPTDGSSNAMRPDSAGTSGGLLTPQNDGDGQPRAAKTVRHSDNSAHRNIGGVNGVSFARVVFAAVQSSVGDYRSNRSSSDKAGIRPYKPIAGNGTGASGTSMRDSFFGLHTRPTIHPAEFPDKSLATKLVELYFEHANPQIPVLHRGDFMQMFELAYADEGRIRGPRELYMLNMVFAIGGGIIMDAQAATSRGPGEEKRQAQPEEYHASAIFHLEACLSNSGGGLEELQAVLLLANFALLRPVAPGLW
jgi:hypothetical protein